MNTLTLKPFANPVNGQVRLPGSKSITNRALTLAALSKGSLTLEGALFSDDTRYMSAALAALGFHVDLNEPAKTIHIIGQGGEIPNPEAEIYVGNAGTAARFLTAMLCLKEGGTYHLDGSEAMRKRPMKGLLDVLESTGCAKVTYKAAPGFFPFTLETKGIQGGEWEVDASASSQILSALLMIAPFAKDTLTIGLKGDTVSKPFVSMTLAMMAQFGQEAEANQDTGPFKFTGFGNYQYPKGGYIVEPDATAASYFMMLPYVTGGQLVLPNTYHISLQGDIKFTEILGKLGAFFSVEEDAMIARFKDLKRSGLNEDFNAISDTFLTLAAITPLLDSPTTISGIAHTRKQETDRVHAMATELRKLGHQVDETEDSLTVTPDKNVMIRKTQNAPIAIDTYDDHRVAMSFGILGSFDLHGDQRPWLQINDPNCCAKTFPNFFELLESLRS